MPKEKTEKTKSALNLVAVLLVIGLVGATLFVNRPKDCLGGYRDDMTIMAGSYSLIAERADTDQSRQTGLSGHECIPEKTGMLFVFEKEAIYPFWMKNTLIPLDMIWIDKN